MNGPCVKQTVTAAVVAPDGRRWVATNHCERPQTVCPRAELPTGVGYELCRSVCQQPGHAEVNALALAGLGALGATLYLEGHFYACDSCKTAAQNAGISNIIVGPAP